MTAENRNLIDLGDPKVVIPTDCNGYWQDRRNHDLYSVTACLTKSVFADAKSCIDVGCHVGGLICEFDWIPHRVASDIQPLVDRPRHLSPLRPSVQTIPSYSNGSIS